jgi:hypothetical protein
MNESATTHLDCRGAKVHRRRFQYTLRSLMLAMIAFPVLWAITAYWGRPAGERRWLRDATYVHGSSRIDYDMPEHSMEAVWESASPFKTRPVYAISSSVRFPLLIRVDYYVVPDWYVVSGEEYYLWLGGPLMRIPWWVNYAQRER